LGYNRDLHNAVGRFYKPTLKMSERRVPASSF
jgi:hypothetical protein